MKVSLSGQDWKYKCDADQLGERENWQDPTGIQKNWTNLSTCFLPACWNTLSEGGIKPYDRYEGFFWFFKQFPLSIEPEKQYFLHFKGINYYCKVWFNGIYLGDHEGGFLPFKLKVPSQVLQENNCLAIEVENLRKADRIPSLIYDWYNWGGIHRDIELLIVPKERVESIHIITESIAPTSADLKVSYKITTRKPIKWAIVQEGKIILEGRHLAPDLMGSFRIKIPDPQYWSPSSPVLYQFQAQISAEGEPICETFGIRTIEVRQSGIFLNNKKIKIRGVSMHEELMPYGRAIPKEERLKDLRMIKKLGLNTLRTAHYSHDQAVIELADQIGILILEEIPLYWYCDFRNPVVFKLAAQMITDLIHRDFNHPSVILWSIGNEIPIENRICDRFIRQLMAHTKKIDPSRIVTYVSSRMFQEVPSDLPCLNLYFGWYMFSERNLNLVLDVIHQKNTRQPLLITEFGADAQFKFHSKGYQKFSEEKQASIVTHSIETFNSKEYIAGWIIWIYRDFRSVLRTNPYQQGFNRKGLFSDKNEPKLLAKLIHRILEKRPKKRRFRILPQYHFILAIVELFVYGLFFGIAERLIMGKLTEKYYSHKLGE